jgi:hypothetical protein
MVLHDSPPYTAVVEWFEEVAGVGSKITAICSPRKFLNAFRPAFPDQTARDMRYNGVPIELIDTQDKLRCTAPPRPVTI